MLETVPFYIILIFFILIALAVTADAIQDTITWKFDNSVFKNLKRQYFDPNISWTNKYKDNDPTKGAKFFGSTTFLVWLTDFYHLIKFLKIVFIYSGITLILGNIFMFPLLMILHGWIFENWLKILKK